MFKGIADFLDEYENYRSNSESDNAKSEGNMTLPKKKIIVIAGVIEKEGKMFIARRKADKTLGGFWEFPGGKLEANEAHRQCLARELKEELNIIVSVGDLVGTNTHEYPTFTVELHAYFAYYLSGEIVLTDHDDFAWETIGSIAEKKLAPADIPFLQYISERIT